MSTIPASGTVRLPEPAPRLSVIIPCRNERATIGACLASVLGNGYPGALEVIVADGESTDGTAALVAELAARKPELRLVRNVKRTTPAALNLALAAATGEVLLRLDAHAALPCGYLATAVAWLYASGAAQVGGVLRNRVRRAGVWTQAISEVLGHPFGVGNARFRTGCREPRWADTVFGGCWRREAVERTGAFDERLERGQDFEWNQRLRAAGGRILLVPELVVDYWVPAGLTEFARQAFRNGRWAVLPFLYSRTAPVSWRHLAPLAALFLGLALGMAALRWNTAAWVLAGAAALYAVGAAGAGCARAWRARSPARAFTLPAGFAVLHASYALGSAAGCVELGRRFLNERFLNERFLNERFLNERFLNERRNDANRGSAGSGNADH